MKGWGWGGGGVYLRGGLVWYCGSQCGCLFGGDHLLECELKLWQCEYQRLCTWYKPEATYHHGTEVTQGRCYKHK